MSHLFRQPAFVYCMLFVQLLYRIYRHVMMNYIVENMCTSRQAEAYIYIAVAHVAEWQVGAFLCHNLSACSSA
jgi:hypothetical protein